MHATPGPAGGPERQGPSSGGGDEENRIRTTEELWYRIEKKRPGLMKRLYDELVSSFTGDAQRRSLLSGVEGTKEENMILAELIGANADNYTEKINAVFLNRSEQEQNITTTTESGPNNPIYVRLTATDIDEASTGSDSGFESATGYDSDYKFEFDGEDAIMGGPKEKKKNPIAQKKALQVVLALNHFINESITWGNKAWTINFKDATSELKTTANVFAKVGYVFDEIFKIFETLETGITVETVNEHYLSSGGRLDFGVLISGSMTSEGHLQPVKEYAAIIEFEPPYASLGLAWKLLNGQRWTPEERSAFFKLSGISPSAFDGLRGRQKGALAEKLHSWQKDTAAWEAAGEVLNQVRSRSVEVKYSNASESGRSKYGENKSREYFVIDDDDPDFITTLLSTSKFKPCLDSSLNSVGKVCTYAAPNGCTRVGIADGLTFAAGSLRKIVKSTNVHSNPGSYDDVLDVYLDNAAMIQTHDEDSALYMLEYVSEAAMSNKMLRIVGDYLITATEDECQDGEITEAHCDEIARRVQNHTFSFNSQQHSSKDRTLVESSKLLAVKARGQVLQALAIFDMHFPGIKSKAAQLTSEAFAVCEWFRENAFEGAGTSESWYGRSKSVAKVVKRYDCDEKLYVLKEYFADEMSISTISHELEAYARVSKLPINERKRVAELVSFGSLDLDAGSPRLYLLLEYVEGYDPSAFDDAREGVEVENVDHILRSVGVCHNDLEDRNYRWQCDSEGRSYIKVFDFDHATFIQASKIKQKCVKPKRRIQPFQRRRYSSGSNRSL